MTAVAEDKDLFLEHFTRFEQEQENSPRLARTLRRGAMARFMELGFPTARTEDWRFTSVAPLLQVPFELPTPEETPLSATALPEPAAADSIRLVFVNGQLVPRLSTVAHLPAGVTVTSLAAVLATDPKKVEPHLARYARHQDLAFAALNTAFLRDGAVVLIPNGCYVAPPIELIHVARGVDRPSMCHPRTLIVAGAGSQAVVLERYLGSEGVYFTNAVTEISLGESAVLDHCKLQEESLAAFHVGITQVHQGRASNFRSGYIAFGGGWVRNEVRVLFTAQGSEATLNGLYLANGRQHIDCHTVIDHAQPHCASHELYKGILAGQAHGVFNGKIFVRPDAQKTDAKQTNQVLLLSDQATINTKPQLEIFADDVKCTHGATVGQLDKEGIFYLQSRGIGLDAARALLTHAFANDILNRVPLETIRQQLEQTLTNRPFSQGFVAEDV